MWQLIVPLLGKVFDQVFPDPKAASEAKLKVLEMQQSGALAALDGELKVALAQAGINAEEAKSPSLFIAGWRPATGWTCVIGLIYTYLLQPLLAWVSTNIGWSAPPTIEIYDLLVLLGTLLGVGSLRTFEKLRGVASREVAFR